jgi:hypothetical protein
MIIVAASILSILTPNVIRTEFQHESHISQHFNSTPFADNHNWGANTAGLVLHWNLPAHAYLELGESYRFQGWQPGPKETTTVRAGFEWQLK